MEIEEIDTGEIDPIKEHYGISVPDEEEEIEESPVTDQEYIEE